MTSTGLHRRLCGNIAKPTESNRYEELEHTVDPMKPDFAVLRLFSLYYWLMVKEAFLNSDDARDAGQIRTEHGEY